MVVTNKRKGIGLAAAALLLGVALGAVGMMSLRGGDGPYATSPPSTRTMGAGPAPSSAFITAVAGNCEIAPVLPIAGDGDGVAMLQDKPATGSAAEVASLILSGKEAAAAGRQRDAEVTFLNACRNAVQLQDSDGMPLADAMYQLARHYANVAAFGSPKSGDLLQRAERLYSTSLAAYRARLGPDHEKTKFAQEGLLTVRQVTSGAATAVAKASPAPAAAAPVPPTPAPAPVDTSAAEPVAPPTEIAKSEPVKPPPRQAAKAPAPQPERPRIAPRTATTEAADDEELAERTSQPAPRAVRRPEPLDMVPAAPPAASMGAGSDADVPTAEGSTGQP